MIARLVALARAEVGTREVGGNNRGARIEEYQQASWLAPGPWPWCAAFTCWVLRAWLDDPAARALVGVPTPEAAQRWRCRDASAFGWEKWARQQGLLVLPETHLARAGDIVVYDFSHIGVVSANQSKVSDPIATIEGNTNGKGDRDSTTGDGVWNKTRAPSLVKCYLRFKS